MAIAVTVSDVPAGQFELSDMLSVRTTTPVFCHSDRSRVPAAGADVDVYVTAGAAA